MAFNIHDIKAKIRQGYAKPNQFKVTITQPFQIGLDRERMELLELNCFQAQIPGHNIATTEKDIGFRSVAYQKLYADIILGFYCTDGLSELKFFTDWIEAIVSPQNNHYNYYKNYVTRVDIQHLNKQQKENMRWQLFDAYPKQVDPISLDYGTTDTVMQFNVTMTYRHFEVDMRGDATNHNQSKTKAERYATDVLGQKGYEFVDETTGRFIPNPNTGTFSNARRLGEVYKP